MIPNKLTSRLSVGGQPVNVISSYQIGWNSIRLNLKSECPEQSIPSIIVPLDWFRYQDCPLQINDTKIVKLFR